jgi:hypothetical protein
MPTKAEENRLRIRGYDDGMKGKPKASTERAYLGSYRRGQERRRQLGEPLRRDA